jgi:uncharacterized protein YndB with AHSA1/START domain
MIQFSPQTDLVFERVTDVAPALIWAAWTQPEHLKQWYAPKPWTTPHCEIDLRFGGLFSTTMRSPEGQDFPNTGCYLEITPNQKLVFTDALGANFRPSEKPFVTIAVHLEPHGTGTSATGTKYTVIAMHKDEAGRKTHDEMGFQVGWGMGFDQMIQMLRTI